MGRTIRGNNTPSLKPVKKVELSEKNIKVRVVLVVLFLTIGAGMIAYAVNAMFTTEAGWRAIEVKTKEANCSEEFVFLYNLGSNGVSATVENKAIVSIYTEATKKAYQLFHNKQSFENVNNVYTINQHPNEVIQVDEVLYEALSLIQRHASRYLYLAPVYSRYDDIFYCNDDSQLIDFDPYLSEAVAEEYSEVALYANDAGHVDVQLLGDNQVKLFVSEEYLSYAKENGITEFIDFFWMKNAFITDYLSEVLIEKGYTSGSISSYDGFVRNLDAGNTSYSFNLFDRIGQNVYPAAVMQCSGAQSIVYLRNYMMNSLDERHYYELDTGEIRTSYVDNRDGFSKSAVNNLVSYSETKGCAEQTLQLAPIFIADTFEVEKLLALKEAGIYSIYYKEAVICYNDSSLQLYDLYNKEDVSYTTTFVGVK